MQDNSLHKELSIIGRAERIDFLDDSARGIPAKIDTGADLSSVWATNIIENMDGLSFTLFAPKNEYYTGTVISLPHGKFKRTRIANSFGEKEMRYVVVLRVLVKGRRIKSTFSLANRSSKIYPVLLGRRLLNRKFLVDVSTGQPLIDAEQKKHAKLQVELKRQQA
ncbi:MAG: RimK/LysX family protein [Patescibacteria group bacterium]|nr:RimK/LysX family protein [Patescibacteria group bacterium]